MCLWPCCHHAIYRLAESDGSLIWRKDWGKVYGTFFQGGGSYVTAGGVPLVVPTSYARALATDGTNIYAGGSRSSPSGLVADCFSVMALDGDGVELWRTDVGAQVHSLLYLAGVGLVVGHDITHESADPVVITRLAGTTNVRLHDETGTEISALNSASAATVQAGLETIPALTGKVTVSGSSWAAGYSFTFDASLFGPTDRRRMLIAGPGTQLTCDSASAADVTILDVSDGSIIGSGLAEGNRVGQNIADYYGVGLVGTARVPLLAGVRSLGQFGSGFLAGFNTDPSGNSVAEMTTAAAVSTKRNIGNGISFKSLAWDGTHAFTSNHQSSVSVPRVRKYDPSFTQLWGALNVSYPLAIEGVDCWVQGGGLSVGPGRRRGADGIQIQTFPSATGIYLDFVVLSGGGYAMAEGDTLTPVHGVNRFNSSRVKVWNFNNTGQVMYGVLEFDGDVIACGDRV